MRQRKKFLRSNISVKSAACPITFCQRIFRYQGLHYRVAQLVAFSLIVFITPLHCVAAMDEISIERIGDVHTGLVENAGGLEKINDPKLLVLSTGHGEPQVLYSSRSRQEGGGRSISFKYHIDLLPLPNSQGKSGSGSLFDDYPITYKGKVYDKNDARTVEAIDLKTIQIGDITGDGADELIFANDPGGLEVYDRKKSLFTFTPAHFQPEIYKYDVLDIQKSSSSGKDSFFYLLHRKPYEKADNLSFDEKRFYSSSERSLIMLVNDKGITRIVPRVSLQRSTSVAVKNVFAVGAITLPASKNISGMVICAQISGKAGIYSIPYDLDGFATGQPRKIMETGNTSDTFHYFSSSHSANIWLFNGSNDEVFTYELSLDEGRVHAIDTTGTTPLGTIALPGIMAGEALLLLDSSKKFIYAVGSQGEYFTVQGEVAVATRKKTPYLYFTPSSGAHTIHDVARVGKKLDKFLLVESRQSQFKEVSDDELIIAGKKYLSDEDYEYCFSKGQVQFNDLVKGEANFQSKQQGLGRTINSLDDLKKNLPDLYKRFSSEARNAYIDNLRIWLLAPLSREELDNSYFKQKEEYYTWLQSYIMQAETVLTLMDIQGKVQTRKVVGDYFQPQELLAASDIPLPTVQYLQVEGSDFFFTALKSGSAEEKELASYYLIR